MQAKQQPDWDEGPQAAAFPTSRQLSNSKLSERDAAGGVIHCVGVCV